MWWWDDDVEVDFGVVVVVLAGHVGVGVVVEVVAPGSLDAGSTVSVVLSAAAASSAAGGSGNFVEADTSASATVMNFFQICAGNVR